MTANELQRKTIRSIPSICDMFYTKFLDFLLLFLHKKIIRFTREVKKKPWEETLRCTVVIQLRWYAKRVIRHRQQYVTIFNLSYLDTRHGLVLLSSILKVTYHRIRRAPATKPPSVCRHTWTIHDRYHGRPIVFLHSMHITLLFV